MAKVTARHILLNNEKLARKLKKEIIKDEITFEKAAKKFSKCPSKKSGGNLGTFSKGEMVREFDTVVFKEDLHRVHGPIKTEFGYHLIEILARY
ncbi:peptidylprolyl isomerase [Malaciobacter pacificus]|uniref:Peptidyl-prolyl cis-trans isomerase C n=1 Tax=Malaciobacter pacificus TaxID=1080223 RepID=A0A5C2HEN7_9BACT|nr:peptidylprolyl isomerase [Malaciobacter pacificus]QEP34852.1 peptidyl-prolyl cis-trans isomerase C [Malaciobacter pacificus]GGD40912.1 peptidylprolyl isomerase [Malaciobacter pacificus]